MSNEKYEICSICIYNPKILTTFDYFTNIIIQSMALKKRGNKGEGIPLEVIEEWQKVHVGTSHCLSDARTICFNFQPPFLIWCPSNGNIPSISSVGPDIHLPLIGFY